MSNWIVGFCGEGGIRTHGKREPSTVFETVPFDHSGTSPVRLNNILFLMEEFKLI